MKKLLLLLFTLFISFVSNAQYIEQQMIIEEKLSVGSDDLPTGSSIFEVGDTLGGVKFPRFTQTQIDNLSLSTADTALMLYNLTDSVYQFYDGDTWVDMQSGGSNIYTSDGVLSGNRSVDLNGNSLEFSGGQTTIGNSPRFESTGSAGSVFYRPASSNGSTNFTQYINLNNSSGSETTYVSLNTRTVTHTAGSEDAEFTLNYINNGSLTAGLQISPSLTTLAGADFTYGDGSITGSSTTGQTLIQASGGLGSSRTRPLAVRRSSASGSVGIEFKSSSVTNGEIYTSFSGGSATGMAFELDGVNQFNLTSGNSYLRSNLIVNATSKVSTEDISLQGYSLIQGSGSTSATTSLEVQNSSGSVSIQTLDDLTVIMPNLPTSSAGLPSGALWNNSGVVNVVP